MMLSASVLSTLYEIRECDCDFLWVLYEKTAKNETKMSKIIKMIILIMPIISINFQVFNFVSLSFPVFLCLLYLDLPQLRNLSDEHNAWYCTLRIITNSSSSSLILICYTQKTVNRPETSSTRNGEPNVSSEFFTS